jgi:hypothetical protein
MIGYALMPHRITVSSVEVSFTDDSKGGMEIVPASCASSPPGAPNNGAAYQLNNGVSNAEVNTQGYNFCVTNSGGPSYFVPASSGNEVGSFYNAVNDGSLPGVSQSANQ